MCTFRASLSLAILLLGAAASCGGNVVVDATASTTSGTGATTSTTGSGATSTGTGFGTGGSSTTCPTLTPNDGDPCSAPGLACPVPVCCGGVATCTGGSWRLTSVPCSQPCLTCPGTTFGCEANAVCVESGADGPDGIYRCAVDPCAGQALSCSCAAPVCGAAQCLSASGFSVGCSSIGI